MLAKRVPVVSFDADALRRLIGKDIATAELAERMPMLGGDLEGVDGEQVTIEWFPDRPDLLPVEGTARALRAFLDIEPGRPQYEVGPAATHLVVEDSVAAVRPYGALCFVRGVTPGPDLVDDLVAAQEKLTTGPGRRRRKVAIGIHDAAGLSGPFVYRAVAGDALRFVPLKSEEAMTPAEVLEGHPKGREFGHLVEGLFPVFLDASGQVVSMPPVINAAATTVTERTTDFLIDVTGTDRVTVRRMVALLATCLADRGGRIEGVEVRDASGTWTCPELAPTEHVLHADDVQRLLGVALDGDAIAACLRRMGHGAEAYGNRVLVESPAWRFDLMHPVDWVEDIAIGHGFDRFPGALPATGTFGAALPRQDAEDRLRAVLCGLGFHEAKTLTLTNPGRESLFGAAPAVALLNPVLEEQTHVRTRILPGLLSILAENRHRALPQRLWELGEVVPGPDGGRWPNARHLAAVEVGARTGFADAKGLVESVLRDLGWAAKLRPADVPGYIPGRAGVVEVDGEAIGAFGELHPDTVVAAGLGAATVAMELDAGAFL